MNTGNTSDTYLNNPQMNPQPKKNSTLIEDVIYKYTPYWPMFVALAILFIGMGWMYTKLTNPTYEVTSSMLMRDEKKGSTENQMSDNLNLPGSKKIVENELEVLKSRTLLDEVVDSLTLYAPIYEKGRIKTTSAYSTSPVRIKFKNPEVIVKAVKKVPFQVNSNSTVELQGKTYPFDQYVQTPYGVMAFVRNQSLEKPAENPLFFALVNPHSVSEGLAKALDISAVGKLTSIVKLKIKDIDTRRGQDILNSLMVKYNNTSAAYDATVAKNTMDFIDQRLAAVTSELKGIEQKVQKYKSDKAITNLGDEGRLYLQNVTQNDQKLGDLDVQLSALNQVEKYVNSRDNSAAIAPSTLGITDATLPKLLDKLYDAQTQYDKLRKTTAENNPLVQSLAGQIESIRPAIMDNLRNQRSALIAARGKITEANGSYGTVLQALPEKERQLIDVSREQVIKNNTYTFLLQKREQTALAYSTANPDTKIIDMAEASVLPVAPKKSTVYLLALAAAVIVTVGFITLKELLTRKILFRKEIEEYTEVPILGELSYLRKSNGIIVEGKNRQILQEQLRQLRAAAGFFHKDNPNKKLLITSSISGEGKSVISANLALGLSLSGARVLLIDADFRNPAVSKQFDLLGKKGVADFLSDKECSQDAIIFDTQFSNLFIIPSGKTSSNNPTELLLNGRIGSLLSNLEVSYDYIIIDSAPVNMVTDAYALSDYCDQTFYVVRHQYTPKTFIKNFDYNNKIRSLKNLALIFNGIKPRGFLKNDYGYGYGYESLTIRKATKETPVALAS